MIDQALVNFKGSIKVPDLSSKYTADYARIHFYSINLSLRSLNY
jgi:hypothetical protein